MSDTILPSVRETYTDEHSLVEPGGVGGRVLDEYRTLYTSVLDHLGQDRGVVLGVCSPLGGEGKTTLATNIAFAMASDLERRFSW
jgi:Mrp family chromosome partitioning ATPase